MRQGNQFVQRIWPRVWRLVRKPSDQIEADVSDACGVQDGHGAINISAAVHAADRFQLEVGERLHAETDAVDSCSSPGLRAFGLDGFRICLESDLPERTVKSLADDFKDSLERSEEHTSELQSP